MTKSVTLLFPGQGSQYVGMGNDIDSDLLSSADAKLAYSLSTLMKEGPEEELKLTANTQPAILTHSIDLFNKVKVILDQAGIKIDRVMGHSVGEYAALVAAGAMRFEDAVKAVNLRGEYMQEAVPVGAGKMIAVMKVPTDVIESVCAEASNADESVMPANFNEPNQTVISGHAAACDRAVKLFEEKVSGPYRVVELNVSAPFHSALMKPAAQKLKSYLDTLEFMPLTTPYVANIDATEYAIGTEGSVVKENLYQQVDGSVRWCQSMQSLSDETLCLEVGPGRVLMGLARKINRNIKVIALDKEGALAELKESLS